MNSCSRYAWALCLAAVAAGTAYSGAVDLGSYAHLAEGGDWTAAFRAAVEEAPDEALIEVPRGPTYRLDAAVELERSVHFRFESGVRIEGTDVALFRMVGGGRYVFEGALAQATLANVHPGEPVRHPQRLLAVSNVSAVIDLNAIPEGLKPELIVSGLRIEGLRGIDGAAGFGYQPSGGALAELRVTGCRFVTADAGIAHGRSTLGHVRIEDCIFEGSGTHGIYLPTVITGSAVIRDNEFRGVGLCAIQVGGGRTFAIDEGAVEDTRNVQVHDNRILGGGQAADERVAYIHGILVYGNQVSIRGNLVRDFHRGEPSPDHPLGHRLRTREGVSLDGIWIPREGSPPRRLAGSAIYAKARFGLIADNVCVNSGWRAVVEVKTGGREPFVIVANNVIDGSSLAVEDSFGMETGAAYGLWANNILARMPVLAIKAGNTARSAYLNNLIVDAPMGLRAFGAAQPDDSLIAGNVFMNVREPVARAADARQRTTQIAAPPLLAAPSPQALPPPGPHNRGQMALVRVGEEDRLVVAMLRAGAYGWHPVGVPAAADDAPLEVPAQALLYPDRVRPRPGAPNLLRNPAHEPHPHPGDEPPAAEEEFVGSFPYGWRLDVDRLRGSPALFAAYDPDVPRAGRATLRVGDTEGLRSWSLSQRLRLEGGRAYLFRAEALRESRTARLHLRVRAGDALYRATLPRTTEWESGSLAFALPEGEAMEVEVSLAGDRTGQGRRVWIGASELVEAVAD